MTLAEVFATEPPTDDAEADATAFAAWLDLPPASRRSIGATSHGGGDGGVAVCHHREPVFRAANAGHPPARRIARSVE